MNNLQPLNILGDYRPTMTLKIAFELNTQTKKWIHNIYYFETDITYLIDKWIKFLVDNKSVILIVVMGLYCSILYSYAWNYCSRLRVCFYHGQVKKFEEHQFFSIPASGCDSYSHVVFIVLLFSLLSLGILLLWYTKSWYIIIIIIIANDVSLCILK